MDGGSDINLLGPKLVADNPHWKTQKSNVGLNFGNASQGTATRAKLEEGRRKKEGGIADAFLLIFNIEVVFYCVFYRL